LKGKTGKKGPDPGRACVGDRPADGAVGTRLDARGQATRKGTRPRGGLLGRRVPNDGARASGYGGVAGDPDAERWWSRLASWLDALSVSMAQRDEQPK
jgi:hypothetical protein